MKKTKLNSKTATLQWYAPAKRAADRWGLPVSLVLAVIDQESAGNPNAIGSAGEVGLMQLKDIAVQDVNQFRGLPYVNRKELADPETNIQYGTAFLDLQISRAGERYDGLRAYNQGYAGSQKDKTLGVEYAREVNAKQTRIFNELHN